MSQRKVTSPGLSKISDGIGLSSDRKSTRLNSSHLGISYAVFCLKKKKQQTCVSNHGTWLRGEVGQLEACMDGRGRARRGIVPRLGARGEAQSDDAAAVRLHVRRA